MILARLPEVQSAKACFKKAFGYSPPRFGRAPGRVELLGGLAWQFGGLAIYGATHYGVAVAMAPRLDGRVRFVSKEYGGEETFWLSGVGLPAELPWANPLKSTLAELRRAGVHFSGFEAAFAGSIPFQEAFGRSSAAQLALALALREVYPYRLSETGVGPPPSHHGRQVLPPLAVREKRSLAVRCQRAAAQSAPRHGSPFDFIPSLFSREHHVLALDAQSPASDLLALTGEILVACDCGVERDWLDDRLRAWTLLGSRAAEKLGVSSLRILDLPALKSSRNKLTDAEYACAYFAVTEARRVAAAEAALREGDHAAFGQCMLLSHEASHEHLRNSLPGLDRLVAKASSHPACLGARLTGPGGGGPMIALVRHHELEAFLETLRGERIEKCREADPKVVQLGEGVR
ncbi:MAG: hypothetical protein FJ404_13005 [Verrucomicrobia bacterium]|nr:hypothetical protein [Verrucomicrobiota bacterium]